MVIVKYLLVGDMVLVDVGIWAAKITHGSVIIKPTPMHSWNIISMNVVKVVSVCRSKEFGRTAKVCCF